MIKYLSYKLEKRNPAYGEPSAEMEIKSVKSIKTGDVCNMGYVGFSNHIGTHIDCPAHFFDNGSTIADYTAECWHFVNPQVIDIKLESRQILNKAEIIGKIDKKSDLLIFRSGWGKFRGDNIYCMENPGIDPEIGQWLRSEFPSIRAIGLDWISVSSFLNREVGREAHRAFLNPSGQGKPILLIEDMDLNASLEGLMEVWVVPLRVEGLDSAPCTVLGVFE